MYSHGVDPKLDFSNMPEICAVYERVTRMHVNDRQPYAGSLVFAAFSGSHQDAIAKGMAWREDKNLHQWTVPYLPIDPKDVSRTYDADVIRINSQSGKGGIGFVLETAYGYNLPPKMREHFGYVVKGVSDHAHAELKPEEVYDVFEKTYLNKVSDKLEILETHFMQGKKMRAVVKAIVNGEEVEFFGEGNGRLNAVNNALKSGLGLQYTLETYSEHSMDGNSASRAAGYVGLVWPDGSVSWGAGTDPDIIQSGIRALVSAINNKINA
jgi:2-isopropylmalate synthase